MARSRRRSRRFGDSSCPAVAPSSSCPFSRLETTPRPSAVGRSADGPQHPQIVRRPRRKHPSRHRRPCLGRGGQPGPRVGGVVGGVERTDAEQAHERVRPVVREGGRDQRGAGNTVAAYSEASHEVLERARSGRFGQARADEPSKCRERGVKVAGERSLERIRAVGRGGTGEERAGVGLEARVRFGELAEACDGKRSWLWLE